MNRQIKSTLISLLLVPFAIAVAASLVSASPEWDKMESMKASAFQDAMRKLWEDHITWTRLFIVSAAADLPDKGPTTDRLLQNQVDIGNAIKPYYGGAAGEKLTMLLKELHGTAANLIVTAGEKLTMLLKEHITTAAELVTAAKAGDTAKMADANKRWYANADAIAAFLSGANPKNWPSAEMKQMMHDHLNLTTTEVQARLKGDWAGDIAAYEKVHEQILHMADMLSAGIISQFPNKF